MHADAEHKSQAVAGLVLAAGFSRRFGSDKRCARLSSGQTLLATSLALPCAQLDEVWVVLRPEDDSTALGIPPQVQVIRCADSQLGMGHMPGQWRTAHKPGGDGERYCGFSGGHAMDRC